MNIIAAIPALDCWVWQGERFICQVGQEAALLIYKFIKASNVNAKQNGGVFLRRRESKDLVQKVVGRDQQQNDEAAFNVTCK